MKVSATRIVLRFGAAVALAGCGGDSDEGSAGTQPTSTAPAPTATAPSATTPPEEPVTVQVNGESRTVTLSRVDSAYCAKKTDVCAAAARRQLRPPFVGGQERRARSPPAKGRA